MTTSYAAVIAANKRRRRPLPDRFWPKVDLRAGMSGCWPWRGALDSDGYGALKDRGRSAKAHRVAWEIANGPIPRGEFVLHRCDNRPCVNPAHLFIGDAGANARDMVSKGRNYAPRARSRGQALVELALVTPVLLLLILGAAEVGNLGVQRLAWANSAAALAEWAAYRPDEVPGPSWAGVVDQETTRTRCVAADVSDAWFDDDLGDHHPGSRVVVTMTCRYNPLALQMWDGVPVTVEGVGIVR